MSERKNKLAFTVEYEGKQLKLAVEMPTAKEMTEASKPYNKAFSDALKNGAILKHCIEKILKEQGLWDDEKKAEWEKLQAENLEIEKKLGRDTKSGETQETLVKLAKKAKENRVKIAELNAPRTSLDNNTVESQAENVRFNHLVANCTRYEDTGKVFFKNFDEYVNEANTHPVAKAAADKFAHLFYNVKEDWLADLPENKFLIKKGLAKYFPGYGVHYINADGKPVDEDGRVLRPDGRYVNAKDELVDKYGDRLDEDGNYIFDDTVASPAKKK